MIAKSHEPVARISIRHLTATTASPPVVCDIGLVFYFDLSPQVEGGQQHLLIDQQNPMALARRPSTDFLPLVGYKEYRVLDLHLLSSFFYRCLPP